VLFRWTYGFDSLFSKLLYIPITFLFAGVSYHLVENPIRRNPFIKGQRSWNIVTVSLALIAASFFSAKYMVDSKSVLSLSVTKDSYIWKARWHRYDGVKEPITDNPHILGRQLFSLGDSHTAAYRTMLNLVSKELGIEVHEYEQGGGAIAGLLRPMSEETAAFFNDAVIEIRERIRSGDVVFLASLRMPELGDQFEPVNVNEVAENHFSEEAVENRSKALEEAHTIIKQFTDTGAYVVMEAPLPVLLAPPYRCSDWFNNMNPIGANGLTVSRDFLEKIRRPVMESIAVLEDTHENFFVWDPFPVLCTDEIFSAYDRDGLPLFWDGDHLSGHGNRILAPSFREFLISLWETGGSQTADL
jgi:hypothetical protein